MSKEELTLELGSIIRINASGNGDLDSHIFFIKYIDDKVIKLIDDSTLEEKQLNINNGFFTDETIDSIEVIDIPDEKGYARQNNLLPNNWISIRFGGEIPDIINGRISNLDEDMIELTTYPDKQVLYIDFGYKGIPLHLLIESISEFKEPGNISIKTPELDIEDDVSGDVSEDVSVGVSEDVSVDGRDNEIEEGPEETHEEIINKLDRMILDADQIEFGEDFDEITQFVPVEKYQERFGIDTQSNDLLDDLLSSIPKHLRSFKKMERIHLMVERFKQLRSIFSKNTSEGDIDIPNTKGNDYKPLKERLLKLDINSKWLYPIVKTKKKIYDKNKDIPNDIYNVDTVEEQSNINDFFKNYKQNTVPDRQNKYNYLFREISDIFKPYTSPENLEDIVIEKGIFCDLEGIVSNNMDFYSTSMKNDSLSNNKFNIQKYNTGITRNHYTDLKNIHAGVNRVNISVNDSIAINGFLQLPEVMLKYSSVFLKKTSILNRSMMNINKPYLFQILKNLSNIETHEITEETEEIYFDTENYLEKMKVYFYKNESPYDERDIGVEYNNLLTNIIPKTRFLFNLIKDKIENNVSYDKIIDYLEHFMIYHEDITYEQYGIITKYILNNILNLNKFFINKHRQYKQYYDHNYGNNIGEVDSYLFETLASGDIFEKYGLKHQSTNEFLKIIYDLDYGKLYTLSLCLTQTDLIQPMDLDNVLEKANEMSIDDFQSPEDKKCASFVLAKQYMAIDELRDDDGNTDIYFDKKYDSTRYSIGEEYKEQQLVMQRDEFINFLSNKLQENVGLTPMESIQETKAIIEGKRHIVDGVYAFLIDEGDVYHYYIRKDAVWVLDESLVGKKINEAMFCNLKDSCINIKNVCKENKKESKNIRDKLVKEILEHFEEDFNLSTKDFNEMLEKKYIESLEKLDRRRLIRDEKKWHYDIKFSSLGMDVVLGNSIRSPNEKLLFTILGQQDFVKKQKNIISFVDNFCREHENESENHYWYYCNITNTQLIPSFHFILAKAYFNGNYKSMLDTICAKQGTNSEDNSEVVDKYSGQTIKKIQLDNSEGFDESGYRMVSREVLERDIIDVFEENQKNITQESEEEVFIRNMLTVFDESMGINTFKTYNSTISYVISSINKKLPSRDKFRMMKKKKKVKYTYEDLLDETLLKYTLGYYLISIQTTIPSIRANKTFPNCIRSFSGYPTEGDGDLSSLKYLICIALKLKTSARPWNRLPKTTRSDFNEIVEKYVSQIKKFMDVGILVNEEIQNKIKVKQDYIKNFVEETIIESEFNVNRWVTFLPPLVPINIKGMHDVSDDFRVDLLKNIEKGNDKQFDQISALSGKIIYFSFHIQQLMDKVVNKNTPLLKDIYTNTSFLQNACCNDGNQNAIKYFIGKNKDIEKFNNYVDSFGKLMRHIYKTVRASQLYCHIDTKVKYPELPNSLSDVTIYKSFIHYGKFNTGLNLESDIEGIIGENNSKFKKDDSDEIKMNILKQEGKQYSESSLKSLLSHIHSSNGLKKNTKPNIISSRKKLENTVEYLKQKQKILICDPKLLEMIETASLDNYDATVNPNDQRIVELLEFLKTKTSELQDDVINFMEIHGIEEGIVDILDNIDNWHTRGTGLYMQTEDETAVTISDFLKTEIKNIMMVYPNIILNKMDLSEAGIPAHWKIHNIHVGDIRNIISRESRELSKFFSDQTIHPILRHMQLACDDLLMLIDSTPFLANMEYMGNELTTLINGKIVRHLMKYYYICGLNMYINALKIQVDIEGDMESLEKLLDVNISKKLDENVVKQIITGKRKNIESKIGLILQTFIKISKTHKDLLNISNKEIKDNILKAKEREKSKITKRLGDLSKEEREVENIMKNQRLGRWNLGQTRALFEYDGDQYEKERIELEKDMLDDIRLGVLDNDMERNRSIFMMDHLEQNIIDARITADMNDMFTEDDGEYGYNEDEAI